MFSTLLSFLFLLSAIGFIVGLIRPATFDRSFKGHATRKKTSLLFGFTAFTVLTIITIHVIDSPRTSQLSSDQGNGNSPINAKVSDPAKSEEDQLKAVVADVLSGKANMSKEPRLKSVDIVPQINGGLGVFVQFNADESFTANMTKKGMDMKMADVYTALYTSGKDIRTASVAAYMRLTDQYGNTKDEMVYKTILGGDIAKRVNWSAEKASLELQILPGLWDATILHASIR